MTSNPPHIAIIGAGPTGLTLAQILLRAVPSAAVTIFESDLSSASRNQGGTLDLHPDDGQRALDACGLTEKFRELARPEGQARRHLDFTGKVLWDDNDDDVTKRFEAAFERPEIGRSRLRDMLIEGVMSTKPETILYGKKVDQIFHDPNKDESILGHADTRLPFPDKYDLVVGADGAWSKIRPLLTDVRPEYSGISMMELWALDADDKKPWLAGFVGRGSTFMFDDGRAFLAQRADEGNIRVYVGVRQPEEVFSQADVDFSDKEAAKRWMLEKYFADCGEDIKRAVLECGDEVITRPLYHLPVGHRWESRKGLTLIGDAAHLMTPFGGVGVNVGMRDAVELGERLIPVLKGEADLAEAVEAYEKEMFLRAESYMRDTIQGLEGHFSAWGNEERVKKLVRGKEKREAWLKKQGL